MRADAELLLREGWKVDGLGWWSHPDRPNESFSQSRAMAAQESMALMRKVMSEPPSSRVSSRVNGDGRKRGPKTPEDDFQSQVERARRLFDGDHPEARPLTLDWLIGILARHQPTATARGATACCCGEVVRPVPPATTATRGDFAAHQADEVRVAQVRARQDRVGA